MPDRQSQPDQPGNNPRDQNPLSGLMGMFQNLQRGPGTTVIHGSFPQEIRLGRPPRPPAEPEIDDIEPQEQDGDNRSNVQNNNNNPNLIARDQRINHVVGMNSQGIQINLRNVENGRFTEQSSVVINSIKINRLLSQTQTSTE